MKKSTTGIAKGVFDSLRVGNTNTVYSISTDGTLTGNSDETIPTEKAIKSYVTSSTAGKDEFTELTDTPSGYTTANALYTSNGTPDAVIETTTQLTEPGANNFKMTKGTTDFDCQADLTVSATSSINQNVTTTGTPTFANITDSGLTASRIVESDGSKQLSSVSDLTTYIAGTSNQITSTQSGGGVVLSTPQNIHTSATPTFSTLNLSSATNATSKNSGALIMQNGGIGVEQDVYAGGNYYSDLGAFIGAQLNQNQWLLAFDAFTPAYQAVKLSLYKWSNSNDCHELQIGVDWPSGGTWPGATYMEYCALHCYDYTRQPIVKIWSRDSDGYIFWYYKIPNGCTYRVRYQQTSRTIVHTADGDASLTYPTTLGDGTGYTLLFDSSDTTNFPPCSQGHWGTMKMWNDTDASSSITGSLQTLGGLGVAKKAYIGTDCNVGGLTASQMLSTDGDKNLASVSDLNNFFTAVANQTSFSGTTPLTIGTVQDINTTSSPQFTGLGVTGTTASTSKTTGALTCAGGVGVSKRVYAGEGHYSTNGLFSGAGLPNGYWYLVCAAFTGTYAWLRMTVFRYDDNYDNHVLNFGFHINASGVWDSSYVQTDCVHCVDSSEIPRVVVWQKDSDSQYYIYIHMHTGAGKAHVWNCSSTCIPTFTADGASSDTYPATLMPSGTGYTLKYDTSVTATYPPTSDMHTGKAHVWDDTDASDKDTASVILEGGLAVEKKAYIGTDCNVGGLTASRLVSTNGDKTLASSDLVNWVAGTSNQVTVTDDTDGTITLSTPQDIATTSSPSFDKIYQREVIEALSASGSISNTIYNKTFIFTKTGSAAAIVLTNPTATTHDGVIYRFVSTTDYQHNVEIQVGNGYNGSGDDTLATCAGSAGDSFAIIAYQGYWYTLYLNNVTLS